MYIDGLCCLFSCTGHVLGLRCLNCPIFYASDVLPTFEIIIEKKKRKKNTIPSLKKANYSDVDYDKKKIAILFFLTISRIFNCSFVFSFFLPHYVCGSAQFSFFSMFMCLCLVPVYFDAWIVLLLTVWGFVADILTWNECLFINIMLLKNRKETDVQFLPFKIWLVCML